MQKKWNVLETDTEKAEILAREIGVSKLLAGILIRRGICDSAKASAFLHPDTEQEFYNPLLMKDMEIAVKRIIKAIYADEKILIFGDYDVDGITAVTVLYRCLRGLGAKVDYYIPDRQDEGYGLNSAALQSFCDQGFKLMITVDCGISGNAVVDEFKEKINIIITDHHIPGEILPDALAVIDPHRTDCQYPDKNLAGVGVSFKLCQAVYRAMKNKNYLNDLEIVALGTIADIVPLIGENRRIASEGLKKMAVTRNVGLKALVSIAAFDCNNIKSDNVAFGIGPRINAAGRMASAKIGVELLLTHDHKQAYQLADELNLANKQRQEVEHEIIREVEAKIDKDEIKKQHIIVVSGNNWHSGVIGIVASRMVDSFYMPSIIISIDDGVAHGSCRSIKNFSIYDALKSCEDLLITFGGHPMAAGVTLPEENLPAFRERIEKYAAAHLTPDDFRPEISVEAEISPAELSYQMIDELAMLEPFGMGNPRPLFSSCAVNGSMGRVIGQENKHLSFSITSATNIVKAIGWNKADYLDVVNTVPFDMVYSVDKNEWQGRVNIQCKLQDIRINDDSKPVDREELGRIYLFIKNNCDSFSHFKMSAEDAALKTCLPLNKVSAALRIFEEISVLKVEDDGQLYFVQPPEGVKLDLNSSPTFIGLQKDN